MPNLDNLKNAKKFTSERQPSPEAKSKGKKKQLFLKDIASQIVGGQAVEDVKPIAEYLGIPESQIDIETLMHLKQMQKAIEKGDTKAYQAVLDRLKGKPRQEIDHTTKGQGIQILNNDPLSD